ncbi:MAG: hypothetical protein CL990_00155 [Euryarchaeota archaeon]|nr:hypothetical protein [Euryarchaeota archaeon]
MASDYDGLTVAELKGLLRDRGLPVSGAKAILVDRLEASDARALPENNQPSPAKEHVPSPSTAEGKKERVRFKCRACGVLLAVPGDHTGMVECPACRTQQSVETSNPSAGVYPFGLTRNQWSVAVSLSGVVIGLLAIVVFFNAFSYEVMCPEENRIEVVQDGETYPGCSGGTWGPTLNRMFLSCCLMVPLAASLTQSGLALRKPRVEFHYAHPMARASSSTPDATSASDEQFADSSSAELLQIIAKWFGLGLTAASTLVALVGAALVVLVLYLVFTY